MWISSCFAQLTTSTSRVFYHIGLTSLYLVPPVLDLRNQPYRRADAVRRSVRRRFDDQNLRPINDAEMVMWRGKSGCDWMDVGEWNRSLLLLIVMDEDHGGKCLILLSVWSGVGSDHTTRVYTHCDVVWFFFYDKLDLSFIHCSWW